MSAGEYGTTSRAIRVTRRNQNKAYVLGLAAVLFWSTVASVFKVTLRYIDPVQLLLYSNFVSVVILASILMVRGRMREAFSGSRVEYARSAVLGFLNPFLYYLILFKAYDLLPAQEAQPLNFTWGLVLPLLSMPLLGQRIGARDLVALLLGYAGVIVISTHGDVLGFRLTDPLGAGLAVGSAFVWALYWIYNAKDERDPVVCLFLGFLFSMPMSLIVCAAVSDPIVSDTKGLLGAAYSGAFEMSVTFVLWLLALKLSENTAKVSMLIFVSPFISLVFIHLIVGEKILTSTIVGLLFIVAGLVLQKTTSRRSGEKEV
ncbi:MAG: DMT family transporter [Candidatus Latescibacterota bacterium]|nr:MAG: DMT family transporter [Candidatus Latescibacterota bacterium]